MSNILDINKKVARFAEVAKQEQLVSPDIIQKTKAIRFPDIRIFIGIFEVQSVTVADGVYNCKQQLPSGGLSDINYEVLNLLENDTVEDYEPMLACEDRMAAWKAVDENGTERWMGIPLTPSVRMARTTEAAGASTSIKCNLIANNGETEITSGLGSGITVYCRATLNENYSAAMPRLASGDYLFAQNISGKWWFVTVLQASEYCVCSE